MRRNPYRIVAALLVAAFIAAPPARARDLVPPNDNFAAATVVDEFPYGAVRDLALATIEPGEPTCFAAAGTVWYRIEAAEAGEVGVWATWWNEVALRLFEGETLSALQPVGPCDQAVRFDPQPGRTYYLQASFNPRVGVGVPRDTVEISFDRLGAVTGTVVDDAGVPAPGVCVRTYGNVEQPFTYETRTRADGTYDLQALLPGRYTVGFGCYDGLYEGEYWRDQADRGDPILVRRGATTTGIDASLARIAGITGTYRDPSGNALPWTGCAIAYDAATGVYNGEAWVGESGTYALRLNPGTYKVSFGCDSDSGGQWYDRASSFEDAATVTVAAKQITSAIDGWRTAWVSPPGDSMLTAIPIESLPFAAEGRFADARNPGDEPDLCGNYYGSGLWLRYTAPDERALVVTVDDALPAYAVWTDGGSGYQRLSCTNGDDGTSSGSFVPEAGRTYLIQVGTVENRTARITADAAVGSQPATFTASIPCGIVCDYDPRSVCGDNASPLPGTYDDLVVTVPMTVDGGSPTHLIADAAPALDRDVFVCRTTGPAPEAMAWATNGHGLHDTVAVPVVPGDRYVVRVFNWADAQPATGSISYLVQR